jgi:hypothetical protein
LARNATIWWGLLGKEAKWLACCADGEAASIGGRFELVSTTAELAELGSKTAATDSPSPIPLFTASGSGSLWPNITACPASKQGSNAAAVGPTPLFVARGSRSSQPGSPTGQGGTTHPGGGAPQRVSSAAMATTGDAGANPSAHHHCRTQQTTAGPSPPPPESRRRFCSGVGWKWWMTSSGSTNISFESSGCRAKSYNFFEIEIKIISR